MTVLSDYITTEYLTLKFSDLEKDSVKTIKSGDCFRVTNNFYIIVDRDSDHPLTYHLGKDDLIRIVFTPNSDNVICYQLATKQFSKKIIVDKEQMMMILNCSSVFEPINIETKLDIC